MYNSKLGVDLLNSFYKVFFKLSGAKPVEITGLEDKRQITALLSCTMSGDLLPPQLLYQGKTENCHPKVNFQKYWDIWHLENHRSNEETTLRFVDKIIIPYVMRTCERLDLPLRHPALAVFDVFAAHRVDSFLTKLEGAGIKVKCIPGGCTGELQSLDLSGNAQFKEVVKSVCHLVCKTYFITTETRKIC